MADEKPVEEVGEEPKGRSNLLVLILAVVISMGAGGGAVYFLLGPARAGTAEESAAEEEGAPAEAGAAEAADLAARTYSLEPFVVNVQGEAYPRYLKVTIDLQADSPETVAEIESHLSQIRDAVIVLLSSRRLEDITDFEGKAVLKEDLLDRLNALLEKGRIEAVLFSEFVVQ